MAVSGRRRPPVVGATSLRSFPVVEIFGPTIQGESPDAGRPAYFVRFGGCDLFALPDTIKIEGTLVEIFPDQLQ